MDWFYRNSDRNGQLNNEDKNLFRDRNESDYGSFRIELDEISPEPASGKPFYGDTPIHFADNMTLPEKEEIPEKLREMRRLYEYGRESLESKRKNFYRQGKFMEDYEDDAPFDEDFVCYYPTYHDLTTRQLRGFFSWRTLARKGEYRPVCASAAYLYLYELLNGIGAASPEDTLQKLSAFEEGYLDSGFGDKGMRANLEKWKLEYSVVNNLPVETARGYMGKAAREHDAALLALQSPSEHSDEEVFSALIHFGGSKVLTSPVFSFAEERSLHIFCEVWRLAQSAYREQEKDLFTLCFGKPKNRFVYPLSNALICKMEHPRDTDYYLSDCRSYHCRGGVWSLCSFETLRFDKERFSGILRETDRKLRRYLKAGHYLREKPGFEWILPYIDQILEKDKREQEEAARPKISIDLSGLDKIRADAQITRDSLLTEEETADLFPASIARSDSSAHAGAAAAPDQLAGLISPATPSTSVGLASPATSDDSVGSASAATPSTSVGSALTATPGASTGSASTATPNQSVGLGFSSTPEHFSGSGPAVSLTDTLRSILQALLQGESTKEILLREHLMPSIAADEINEAFYEEIGDNIILCENDELSLVEDYREDLEELLS